MPYDILAADDILGLDVYGTELRGDSDLDYLLAGADDAAMAPAATSAAATAARRKGALRQIAERDAIAVVPRAYNRGRTYFQGFGPTVVAAGATANIIVQPQVTFKPNRLTVPSDIAGAIQINDLKIGQASQFPSSNALPARGFTEFAVDSGLNFDTAQVSQQVSINVTNVSGASVTFLAMLRGRVAL